MRLFNLSSNDGFFRNKIKAATLEDDILLLTNTQVEKKSNMPTKELNMEGYGQLNNSPHNNMKGVSIALKILKISR